MSISSTAQHNNPAHAASLAVKHGATAHDLQVTTMLSMRWPRVLCSMQSGLNSPMYDDSTTQHITIQHCTCCKSCGQTWCNRCTRCAWYNNWTNGRRGCLVPAVLLLLLLLLLLLEYRLAHRPVQLPSCRLALLAAVARRLAPAHSIYVQAAAHTIVKAHVLTKQQSTKKTTESRVLKPAQLPLTVLISGTMMHLQRYSLLQHAA
jgi:hypothetical protein